MARTTNKFLKLNFEGLLDYKKQCQKEYVTRDLRGALIQVETRYLGSTSELWL